MTDANNFNVDLSNVTLAILAGGRGARMGIPKAHLQVAGVPILEWIIQHYQWPGPTILVTAPAVPNPPAAKLFDRFLVDPVDDLGPLRGIATAMENASTEIVAIVTVDMPGITRHVLEWMLEAVSVRPELGGLMCCRRIEQRDVIEPFPSLFRVSATNIIHARLQSGDLSVQRLCHDTNIVSVVAPEDWPADTWLNLNHLAELAAFEASIKELGDRHET